MGGGKATFKLIAAQRSEHDWTGVPNEELIPAPDDAPYANGVLVMVELTSNRQVKRHQEAGRPLVSVLQNFSGMNKKFKSQGEEIEQWKESLTYQSQALSRREMEIETRREQIEQAEADLESVRAQQQEIEEQKAAVDQLQADLARKNAELKGAWAHLNGEIQQFEERKEEFQAEHHRGGSLSDEQTAQINSALADLGQPDSIASTVAGKVTNAFELMTGHQADLDKERQHLEQRQAELTAAQAELDAQTQNLLAMKQSLVEAELKLHNTQVHLQQQQSLLVTKQEHNHLLTEQLKNQTELHQQVYELLSATDKVRLSKKVDVASLEAMAEEELQALVTKLEKDLEKMIQFVNDQEEELKLQQDEIDALKGKLTEVNDYDRLQLETEIEEANDRHVMLARTLVGQRRNLLERQEVLSQHQAVLLRRQGLAADEEGTGTELEPVLDEIDKLRALLDEQIQQLEAEIAQIQSELDTLKQTRQQQQQATDKQRQKIADADLACRAQYQVVGELQGQVMLYESMLSIMEGHIGGFEQVLEEVSIAVGQWQEAKAEQQRKITLAQQMIETLSSPEPALV
ncbi:hypothetical protein S7335_2577 [Synechococcus sp. PCC 7335]|nr:hypothetical protein S7335_2577 [Synechococcus sp. PCC 7335]